MLAVRMQLDVQTRARVVHLKNEGYTYKRIHEKLMEDGVNVSAKSLYLLVRKYKQTGSVLDRSQATVPNCFLMSITTRLTKPSQRMMS